MKKIALAVSIALGLGMLGFATSADAAKKMAVNNAKYVKCRTTVMKSYSFSPGALTMIDMCYRGMRW